MYLRRDLGSVIYVLKRRILLEENNYYCLYPVISSQVFSMSSRNDWRRGTCLSLRRKNGSTAYTMYTEWLTTGVVQILVFGTFKRPHLTTFDRTLSVGGIQTYFLLVPAPFLYCKLFSRLYCSKTYNLNGN